MPELPPWISTVCRADSPAVITRFDQTVQVTSGRPAASTRSTPARDRQHLHGRDNHLLRVPAAGQQGADLVADLPADDPGAEGGDGAGALHPEDRGSAGRDRVLAGGLQQVGPIDGTRRDVDQHLARPGDRVRELRPAQRRG